jgi:glycerol kinase
MHLMAGSFRAWVYSMTTNERGVDRPVHPAKQPEIVDCAAVVGETGAFGGRLPVAGLAVDQQAALGHGVSP